MCTGVLVRVPWSWSLDSPQIELTETVAGVCHGAHSYKADRLEESDRKPATLVPNRKHPEQRRAKKAGVNPPAMNWLLLVALLVGAFFRWNALRPMNDMLHYDEAYEGIDSLSLLRDPRLTPFFPGNFGREAAWMYCLVPFVAVFGAQPLGLRLAATIVGVLTLAATHRLAAEVVDKRAAIWATATLAVLYWSVHLNHLALRANLFPLIGALAFAALFRAQRTNKPGRWMAAGVLLGLLIYTYYAARFWMLYALVPLAWWIITDPRRRRGSLLALCTTGIVCLPMILYSYAHPKETEQRIEMVAAFRASEIKANAELWAKAWFQRGDLNAEFNLPGRPILDPALGVLFLTGLAAVPLSDRRRWPGPWILGLAVFSVLPSLLSNQSPHFLRGIGLTLPIALVAGAGASAVERGVRRKLNAGFALLLPLSILAVAGVVSYRDFHVRWLRNPQVPILMEEHINQAINFMRDHVPTEMPVYFSPFTLSHPVLVFRGSDLAPRQIGAFDSHYCMAIADGPATYFSLTLYEPSFEQRLSQWADLSVLQLQPASSEDRTLYTVFQATTHPDFLSRQGATVLGDAIEMRSLLPISSTAHAGQVVPISLSLRALRPLSHDYSVFIHLYGEPTPYEGGPLWAQGDSQVCATYSSRLWRTNETIVQDFTLSLPVGLPAGTYTVAAGIYESPAGARLPITLPGPRPNDFIELQRIEVERPDNSP